MRNFTCLFLTLLMLGVGHFCHAQFEGEIKYAMTYSSEDTELQSLISSLPTKSTLLVKDNFTSFSQPIAGGGKQAFISNSTLGTSTLLMNFMGQPFQVKVNESDLLQLQQTKKLKIVKGKKKKHIAGFECFQAFAFSGKDTLEIYYTPKIKTPLILPQFENLSGLPMEYQLTRGNLTIRYLCTSITEEPIAASNFKIPDSVREIPFAEFAKAFAVAK